MDIHIDYTPNWYYNHTTFYIACKDAGRNTLRLPKYNTVIHIRHMEALNQINDFYSNRRSTEPRIRTMAELTTKVQNVLHTTLLASIHGDHLAESQRDNCL